MNIAILGTGAISAYLHTQAENSDMNIRAALIRRTATCDPWKGVPCFHSVAELPGGIDLLIDCAGHQGLRDHGVAALAAGIDVLTISLGALADRDLEERLSQAAMTGGASLHLASGAIGALDALRAARVGSLARVKYTGRKPPKGWVGSPAEERLDLDNLEQAETHFAGSARVAAITYPKNANVAAAVALSSLGFDRTEVELIADPNVSTNIHEIEASGDFGALRFSISGNSLPDNPRTSALAAMSVVAAIAESRRRVRF